MIKAVTFAPFVRRGVLGGAETEESLKLMAERTGATHVVLAPAGLQETPQSEEIVFDGWATMSDLELQHTIESAQKLGLEVILKPTVNCLNGAWRAFINFFDMDVVCEPKWGNWFKSHEKFQLHYAKLARESGCTMFITGCEMVMSERREREWRHLIGAVKSEFGGLVSYNTDKYQEGNVAWWDAADVISSSGYYPLGDWNAQLDRIEAVVRKFDKPFFFAETGCMSRSGSAAVPNDWSQSGEINLDEQACWYDDMFAQTLERPWVGGWALWAWPPKLYGREAAKSDGGYGIYGKPSEKVVRRYWG
ncbi:hypothetical protein FACS189425_01000 [Clostridia bacterium]|nr:hypothetical protein FACS189425_01000 [Clostridia bacterium]